MIRGMQVCVDRDAEGLLLAARGAELSASRALILSRERWYFKGGMIVAFFSEQHWQELPTLDMHESQ